VCADRDSRLLIAIGGFCMGDRLLVVDADPSLREGVSSFLQANGFQVLTAADAREGLRIAYEYHPALVIVGLALPDLDGCNLCVRLRDLSDVPILMLVEGPEEEAVVTCLEAGADDCIDEPLRLGELVARVRALLRRVRATHKEQIPEHQSWEIAH
jgi:DNA-binding response OmpR family regulator